MLDYFTATGMLNFMLTLFDRKDRDIKHLEARLIQVWPHRQTDTRAMSSSRDQHAHERENAIERDNPDDLRRADRDKVRSLLCPHTHTLRRTP
jgi:hypothetical protein